MGCYVPRPFPVMRFSSSRYTGARDPNAGARPADAGMSRPPSRSREPPDAALPTGTVAVGKEDETCKRANIHNLRREESPETVVKRGGHGRTEYRVRTISAEVEVQQVSLLGFRLA